MLQHSILLNNSDVFKELLSKRQDMPNKLTLCCIHYNSSEYKSRRWTERSRDLIRKRARMLQFDVCVGYLLSFEMLVKLQKSLDACKKNCILNGSRWYKGRWVDVVDNIEFDNVSWIEV